MQNRMIKIGSRGSKLALWQAHFLQSELGTLGVSSEIIIIQTKGDVITDVSFDKMEGKGFFTKEIEDALLESLVDIAVHSMKDLSTTQPEGLTIGAVSNRENPADCLLIHPDAVNYDYSIPIKKGAIVGTSSARRKSLLQHFRPDIEVKPLRGNVPTRIKKLESHAYDGIILAQAGINRLGLDLSNLTVKILNPREFVPAPAQGVLAFQCRTEDIETRKLLARLHHKNVGDVTNIERSILHKLEGGCQLPLGVYCEKLDPKLYRVYASYQPKPHTPLTFAFKSQSTKVGLADDILTTLKNETKK